MAISAIALKINWQKALKELDLGAPKSLEFTQFIALTETPSVISFT